MLFKNSVCSWANKGEISESNYREKLYFDVRFGMTCMFITHQILHIMR